MSDPRQGYKEFKTELILCDDGQLRTGLVIQETPTEIHFIANLLKPENGGLKNHRSSNANQQTSLHARGLSRLVNKKSTISRVHSRLEESNDERNRTEMETVSILASVAMLLNLGIQKPDPRIGISSGAEFLGDWIRFPPVQFGPEENVIWSTEVAPVCSSIAGNDCF